MRNADAVKRNPRLSDTGRESPVRDDLPLDCVFTGNTDVLVVIIVCLWEVPFVETPKSD